MEPTSERNVFPLFIKQLLSKNLFSRHQSGTTDLTILMMEYYKVNARS